MPFRDIVRPRETRERKEKKEKKKKRRRRGRPSFSPIYFGNHKQVIPKSVIGDFSAIVPGSFTAGNTV
jgi:hypothetical protein